MTIENVLDLTSSVIFLFENWQGGQERKKSRGAELSSVQILAFIIISSGLIT